jgi:hypothetical protein
MYVPLAAILHIPSAQCPAGNLENEWQPPPSGWLATINHSGKVRLLCHFAQTLVCPDMKDVHHVIQQGIDVMLMAEIQRNWGGRNKIEIVEASFQFLELLLLSYPKLDFNHFVFLLHRSVVKYISIFPP